MSEQPNLPEPDDNEREATRRLDPELKVIGAIIRLLDGLDLPARTRAVQWLTSRFGQEGPG